MPRKKGTPKTGGRKKGTPNKTTSTVKGYITDLLAGYLSPVGIGQERNTLAADLANLLPVDRVTAITKLAAYVIPKQQALSIEEQTKVEADALTEWLETAPDEAINAIAEKVLELQARNASGDGMSK